MSRGLGAHERRVLAQLGEHGALYFRDLCPGTRPERATIVRRVLSLRRTGRVSGEVVDDIPGRPVVWRYTGLPPDGAHVASIARIAAA